MAFFNFVLNSQRLDAEAAKTLDDKAAELLRNLNDVVGFSFDDQLDSPWAITPTIIRHRSGKEPWAAERTYRLEHAEARLINEGRFKASRWYQIGSTTAQLTFVCSYCADNVLGVAAEIKKIADYIDANGLGQQSNASTIWRNVDCAKSLPPEFEGGVFVAHGWWHTTTFISRGVIRFQPALRLTGYGVNSYMASENLQRLFNAYNGGLDLLLRSFGYNECPMFLR